MALNDLYGDGHTVQLAKGGKDDFDHTKFDDAAQHVYSHGGFNAHMMSDEDVRALTHETYRVLSSAIGIKQEVPDELRRLLSESTFVFSGFKTYHELREVSALMQDENGGFKSWDKFSQEVTAIDQRYNKNYLRAEYDFAVQSAQMAAKWKEFEADGDDYLLQYRTAGDDKVRAEHAVLHNTTLPIDDPFWDEYLPPLDWGCRCTTVQVLRDKYPVSNSEDAIAAGERATDTPKKKIFRFNPGKTGNLFPPKHPYLPKGCGNCNKNLRLAYDANSERCRVCKELAAEQKRVLNKERYDELRENPEYSDVRYDAQTGGVTAIHIEHNFDPTIGKFGVPRGDYERNAIQGLFLNGHMVILNKEESNLVGIKQPDGFIDGRLMDIKGVEGNCLYAMNRANVQKVDTCILYFHDETAFSLTDVRSKWENLPNWIENNKRITDKTIYLRIIMCVVRTDSSYNIYEIKNPE